jgi:hypothetical protein
LTTVSLALAPIIPAARLARIETPANKPLLLNLICFLPMLLSPRWHFDQLNPQSTFAKRRCARRSCVIVMELQHRIFIASIGGR